MRIYIHGYCDRGMSQPFADELRVGSSEEHQAGVSVSKVVEPNIGKPSNARDFPECVADRTCAIP